MPSLRIDMLEADAAPGADAGARFLNAPQESRIGFEAVLEPIIFRFKADQHAGRPAVARDDDLMLPASRRKRRRHRQVIPSGDWSTGNFDWSADF
ncbi:MAG TPA: hypothetical protein VMT54_16680 [Candidatus Cybelea sp.]|nr:hypothetical protein [Candidatus Cybelea sp.]